MNPELDLLAKRDWLQPSAQSEPMVWVREVRLLYRLEAGEQTEIRRVQLHCGVNIVWAKPADPDEPDPAARGRGHDVGKTSFCRLIRYLLGEEPFAREELRHAIAAKPSFSRAWVLGEIRLDGNPWAVARPLYVGAHPFAIEGANLDQLLAAPAKDRRPHNVFVKAVERRVVGSLAVQTFDDGGHKPIQWLHVLQWLARDQEAHLAGLFKWRDASSDHESPELSASEAQFLARCILGVTDVEDRRQIERRNLLAKEKTIQTETARYLERRIKEALQRASEELPDGSQLPQVGESLFVDAVVRHAKLLVADKRATLESQLASLKSEELEAALEEAIGATALAKSRHDDLFPLVQEAEDSLARFGETAKPTQKQVDALDAIIAKLTPDRAYCEIPVNIAFFRCPLLQEKRMSEEVSQNPVGDVAELAEHKGERIAKQLVGLKRNLEQFSEQFADCRSKEAIARRKRDEMRELRRKIRDQMASLDDTSATWKVRAEDASLSHRRLEDARKALETVETQLDQCRAKQDEAQKNLRTRQGELAEVFQAVCCYFKGDQANAELRFTRDEINARIGSGGGAYNVLSSLVFDFCALLAALNGIGHHPRFLIHDSPRESDMELSLYRPLFQLAGHLESVAASSFQYIVTTTEPPPPGMATPPHLCLELDASKPDGKLFKEEL